ncbi:MAG: FAD-dependent oxidoreductase, partial [Thermoplasmata archaeon]|nr:FAD-dependent oxidoreductase [Thermoplasmata archaeon]
LDGIEARGVLHGVGFLKDINTGKLKPGALDNEEIVVIGGGNVAVDVARSSLRLGAKRVYMVCLEDRNEMPAHDWEVEQVLEEGVELHTRLGPGEIKVRNNAVEGIFFIKCLRVFDEDGRFNPSFDHECTSELKCDKVILAIGQEPETEFMEKDGIELLSGGWIKADRLTLQTSIPYVFAGGEAATGPASAVETIGSGHEAAESIDRFLRGEDLREGRERDEPEAAGIPDKAPRYRKERNEPEIVQPSKRIGSFLEIEKGFTMDQLLSESRRCLNCSGCCECLQCVEYCGREAIDHGMVEEEETLNVGAIIVSPGLEEFDPSIKEEYGYHRFPNVLSSIEIERMLSASGPYKGHIQRISDGKAPGKIAWLQCVGSRDESCNRPYCSSVCCMYATKEAVIAKEHQPGLDTHIYFMDMRSFGKDFDRYFERAKNEYGVVYRRCRIPGIEQDRETKDLLIRYIDSDGKMMEDRYDMVVLSVGLQ